jgi:hypothetical protein
MVSSAGLKGLFVAENAINLHNPAGNPVFLRIHLGIAAEYDQYTGLARG